MKNEKRDHAKYDSGASLPGGRFGGGAAGGYLTVEAALVLPVALLVQIFILYLLFFQYDRCRMEQDIGSLLICGVSMQEADRTKLAETLVGKAAGIYREKYIAWSGGEVSVHVERNVLTVEQTGTLSYPFAGIVLPTGPSEWSARVRRQGDLLEPTAFLRLCRRFKLPGERENGMQE